MKLLIAVALVTFTLFSSFAFATQESSGKIQSLVVDEVRPGAPSVLDVTYRYRSLDGMKVTPDYMIQCSPDHPAIIPPKKGYMIIVAHAVAHGSGFKSEGIFCVSNAFSIGHGYPKMAFTFYWYCKEDRLLVEARPA